MRLCAGYTTSMQFQVPQFIEVEDKIVGPLTFRQFVYLAGGGGVIAILYVFLPLFLVILLGIPVAALSAALAFYKINNRPFIETLEAAFYYMMRGRLYLWKKVVPKAAAKATPETKLEATIVVPKLSESKLKDLAWSLDIKEKTGAYR